MPVRRKATTKRWAAPRRTTRTKTSNPWTKEEMAFMRKFYRRFETKWVAHQMGRTVYSVRYKAVDMGIKKATPSVWRGNKGSTNAFKAVSKGRKTTTRKTATRRSTSSRGWRASSTRRTVRRTARRTIKKRRTTRRSR